MTSAKEFLERMRGNRARIAGRDLAFRHYQEATGASREDAESFYEAAKAGLGRHFPVLNIPLESLPDFLAGRPLATFNLAWRRAEKAIGCEGLVLSHGIATSKPHGDRSLGACSLVLASMPPSFSIAGGVSRILDPNDHWFDPNLDDVTYDSEGVGECRVVTAILGLGRAEMMAGPGVALRSLLEGDLDKGSCPLFILSEVRPSDVSRLVVNDEGQALAARDVLGLAGRLIPVLIEHERAAPPPLKKKGDETRPVAAHSKYFVVGDRVVVKPMASQASRGGAIAEVADGKVVVQWDDDARTIFDATEALMSLMREPRTAAPRPGMVVYSLPWLDDQSIEVLSQVGVDPVSLSSLVSHFIPYSDKQQGWEHELTSALSSLGIRPRRVSGHVLDDKKFKKGAWLEARLPFNNRLVLDIQPGKVTIRAGAADEYVSPFPGYFSPED